VSEVILVLISARYDAAALAALGVPAFACTPDLLPELMGAAIERRELRPIAERETGRS
jgi:hypothetical protein